MTEKNEQKVVAWALVGRECRPIPGTAEMVVDVVGRDGPRMAHAEARWEEVYLWEAKVYAETDSPNPPTPPATPPLDALRALEREWRADAVCARKRAAAASSNKRRLQELGSADTYETTASELAATIKAMGGENGAPIFRVIGYMHALPEHNSACLVHGKRTDYATVEIFTKGNAQ